MYNYIKGCVDWIDDHIGTSHTVTEHDDGSVEVGDGTNCGYITHLADNPSRFISNVVIDDNPYSVENEGGNAESHPDLQTATCALLVHLYEWKVYAAVYERPKKICLDSKRFLIKSTTYLESL